jgi:hypothetical protein
MAVICQLRETGGRLSIGCITGGCGFCQLLEAGWRLSAGCVYAVCYLRQYCGYLLVA